MLDYFFCVFGCLKQALLTLSLIVCVNSPRAKLCVVIQTQFGAGLRFSGNEFSQAQTKGLEQLLWLRQDAQAQALQVSYVRPQKPETYFKSFC